MLFGNSYYFCVEIGMLINLRLEKQPSQEE